MRKGDDAVEAWVEEQMAYKSAVVVLVGAQTAHRNGFAMKIGYAWENRKPLVGIRIHGLADKKGNADTSGPNPFSYVTLKNGKTVGDYVSHMIRAGGIVKP